MRKCDFNKVAIWHVCSPLNLLNGCLWSSSNIFLYIVCFYLPFDWFSKSFIYKDFFCFLTKRSALSPTGILIIEKNMLVVMLSGVCTEEHLWRLILFLKFYTSSILLSKPKENFRHVWSFFLSLLYSFRGELIQVSLN